jgi:hypothetical protein
LYVSGYLDANNKDAWKSPLERNYWQPRSTEKMNGRKGDVENGEEIVVQEQQTLLARHPHLPIDARKEDESHSIPLQATRRWPSGLA